MTQEILIALVAFLFPLAYSPGPGNLFFAANGAQFGFAKTIPATIGYHVATLLVTLSIGFGFIHFLFQYPFAFSIIKWAGSAYIFWLAYKLFYASFSATNKTARSAGFLDGVILLLLNPKAYLIIVAMFSQFPPAENTDQVWIISAIFTINNLIAFSIWTVAGDFLVSRFRTSSQAKIINRVFGTMLAMIAGWILLR